jgi:hypothetical protein
MEESGQFHAQANGEIVGVIYLLRGYKRMGKIAFVF